MLLFTTNETEEQRNGIGILFMVLLMINITLNCGYLVYCAIKSFRVALYQYRRMRVKCNKAIRAD